MKGALLTFWHALTETPLIDWLAVAVVILATCTDWPATIESHRADWALSDRMAQSDKQIAKCLEERGAGAVVVFDEGGFYKSCSIRRGKRSSVLLAGVQQ